MNSSINLKDIKQQLRSAQKYTRFATVHAAFLALLIVLLAYSFLVWRVNRLASIEPSQADEATAIAKNQVPKIDEKAISNIQSLEKNSSDVHALFSEARKNPFQE